MTKSLEELIEAAKKIEVSDSDRERHRRSFAFGNTNMENDRITREMIDAEAEKLNKKKGS